jgi:Protein of unknown function (DUF778)
LLHVPLDCSVVALSTWVRMWVHACAGLPRGAPLPEQRSDVLQQPRAPPATAPTDSLTPVCTLHAADLVTERARAAAWDSVLAASTSYYQTCPYNFLGNNCHCFVAHCLNGLQYEGHQDWQTVSLATRMFLRVRATRSSALHLPHQSPVPRRVCTPSYGQNHSKPLCIHRKPK